MPDLENSKPKEIKKQSTLELKKELLDELKGFEEMKNETETKRLLLKAKVEEVGDDFSEYEKLFEDAKKTLDKIILRLEEIKGLNEKNGVYIIPFSRK